MSDLTASRIRPGTASDQAIAGEQRRRLEWMLPASLALHLLVIALVMLVHGRPAAPPAEPPGFAMLWTNGAKRLDAVPAPGARPEIPAGENTRTLAPSPPVPPPTAAEKEQQSRPVPVPNQPAPAPAPPMAKSGEPLLPPVTRRAEHAQTRHAPDRANPFAHAMNYSFSQAPRSVAGGRLHGSRSLDLSMGLNIQGGMLRDAVPHVSSPGADGDYIEQLSEYIEIHKFYPERAASNGEDGVAVVRATIARDGTVNDVELEQSSGSRDLDDAWLSLFRHKHLAPFPDDMKEAEKTFELSMDYILVRG